MENRVIGMFFPMMFKHRCMKTELEIAQSTLKFFDTSVEKQMRFHSVTIRKLLVTFWAGYILGSYQFVISYVIGKARFFHKGTATDIANVRRIQLMSLKVLVVSNF